MSAKKVGCFDTDGWNMLYNIWLKTPKDFITDANFHLLVASGLLHLVEPSLAGTQPHWSTRLQSTFVVQSVFGIPVFTTSKLGGQKCHWTPPTSIAQ